MLSDSKKWKFRKKGFTLIEVLVVLVIAGIGFSIAIPTGFNFWARIQLEEAQNNILRSVRTARTNALSSQLGNPWEVRLVQQGDQWFVQVEEDQIVARDPAVIGDYSIRIPDFNLGSSRFVDVITNDPVEFDSRGFAQQGSFVIFSPILDGDNPARPQRRCVVVSTLLGAIRANQGSTCPG